MSMMITNKPGFHPSILNTFVPPAFPLPWSLMSTPLIILPVIMLIGVDPNK